LPTVKLPEGIVAFIRVDEIELTVNETPLIVTLVPLFEYVSDAELVDEVKLVPVIVIVSLLDIGTELGENAVIVGELAYRITTIPEPPFFPPPPPPPVLAVPA
jgi:hypothetical protein